MTAISPIPKLSQESIEALYSFGYGFYESGNYEKAVHFFRLLTLVDIQGRKHWKGLGASYQMLKQYERALQCYAQTAVLDEKDPYAHWHAAECFLALKKTKEAQQALTSARQTAALNPQKYESLIKKLELYSKGK